MSRALFLAGFLLAAGTGLPLAAQTNAPATGGAGVSTNTAPERMESVQIDLGNGFLSREFYDLAMSEYRKYLEWFPGGAYVEEAMYRIGDCLRGLGRLEDAKAQYQSVQKSFPKGAFFARSAFRIGELDWNAGRYPEALRRFSEAVDTAESPETRLTSQFYKARTLIELKKGSEARPVLQDLARVEKQNPYRGFALLELAKLVEAAGQEEEARVLYGRVLDTDSAAVLRAEGGLKAGVLEMKAKRWAAAASDFEKVRKLEISDEWMAFANQNLARSYYQADQYDAVAKLLLDPKTKAPAAGQAETDLLLAHSLRLLKRYKEAVDHYDAFLKAHPGHAASESAAYERLISLYALGASNWDAEASAFLKAWPSASGAPQAVYLMADRAFRRKDYAAAASSYAAIPTEKIDPALLPEILYRQGFSLMQLGRNPEAVQVYADFLQRFPRHDLAPGALFQKGLAEQQAGRIEAALATFRDLVDRFPKSVEREGAIYRVALLQGELKQYAAMRQAFQQLAKEYPKNAFGDDAAYWTGWSLFEEQKYAEALPFLEQARRANPADYGATAGSRILLSFYHLKQRAALVKEVDALPANTPPLAPEIYDWMARSSMKEEDAPTAERYFRRLIAHPDAAAWRPASRWGLAQSLAAQSKWKPAIEVWEAYQKDYTSPVEVVATRMELIRVYMAIQDYAKAQALAEDILRLQPEGRNNAEARYLLGQMMSDQKKFAEAGKYFVSVAVLYDDPELTPRSLAQAVRAFESAGETNQVAKLRQELQTKYPSYKP